MSRELIDSNLKWLGKLPKNYKKTKLKYISTITTGSKDANASSENGVYPFFTCSKEEKKINDYSFDTEALLVAGNGIVGFTRYYKGKFDAYQRTYVIDHFSNKVSPQYLKYYISNLLPKKLDENKIGSVIDFIKLGDMKGFEIFYPEIKEQNKIANYLDKKCTLIDEIIKDNKKEIELLNEYKNSLTINLATRGVGKTLTRCEIDWLDYIPNDWKISYLFEVSTQNKRKNKNLANTNLLSLSYGKIIEKNINSNNGLLPETFENYQIVKKGDIILRLTDLQNDKRSLRTGLVTEDGIITSAYVCLIVNDINSKYLHYLLHSYDLLKVFYNMGSGVRQQLNFSGLKRLKILIPPLKEQEQIISILDKKENKINKVISYRQQIIEKLEEYKKSLIYEVVTGKKGV